MKKRLLTLLVIAFSLSYAGFFLDNGIGLKGMQVGGAYTSQATGVDAIYWNPARVALGNSGMYVSYAQEFGDATEYSLLYTTKLTEDQSLGIGYYRMGVDNIPQYSATSANMGSFQFSNEAFYLSYSRPCMLVHGANVGFSIKNIVQKAVANASYQSLDIGFSEQIMNGVGLGFVAQDILSNGNPSDIKPIYRLGVDTEFMATNLELDYIYYSLLGQAYPKVGLAYAGLAAVTLKAGFNGYDNNLYAGMSLNLSGIKFDYLFTNPEYGVVHQFGLGLDF